jgi:hypothetical protein
MHAYSLQESFSFGTPGQFQLVLPDIHLLQLRPYRLKIPEFTQQTRWSENMWTPKASADFSSSNVSMGSHAFWAALQVRNFSLLTISRK